MEEQVIVTIFKDGRVKVEVNGVVGGACKDITKAITDALSGNIVSSVDKPEMYYELDGIKTNVTL
jgi:hypothetical protein